MDVKDSPDTQLPVILEEREETVEEAGTLVKAVRGGKWMFMNILMQKFFTFFIFLMLSRRLAPEDFGIIAVVLLVINTIDNLSVISFERAITQKREAGIAYYDPAWTFNVLRGAVLCAFTFVAAPLLANFFKSTEAIPLIRIGGFLLLVESLSNIGMIDVFKALDFKKIFIRDFVGQVAQFTVSFVWALVNPSVYALLAGHLARTLVIMILTYILDGYRPVLSFQFHKLKDLVGYSKWVTAQGFSSYAMGIVDNTFVGHLLGPTSLGFYSKALSISSLVSSQIFNVIYRVGFPAYSRIQDKLTKVQEGFIKSLDIAFLMALPFLLFVWLFGERMVLILFGIKWVNMVAPLKVLTISATAGAFINITLPVFDGLGKPQVRFHIDLLRLVILLGLLVWLVPMYGMVGAALAVTASFVIALVYVSIKISNVITVRVSEIWPALVSSFIPTVLVAGTIYILRNIIFVAHRNEFLGWMTALSFEYLLLFLFVGYFIQRGPYKTFTQIVCLLATEYFY